MWTTLASPDDARTVGVSPAAARCCSSRVPQADTRSSAKDRTAIDMLGFRPVPPFEQHRQQRNALLRSFHPAHERSGARNAPEIFAGVLEAHALAVDDLTEADPVGIGGIVAHAEELTICFKG